MRTFLQQINDKLIQTEQAACAMLLFVVLVVTLWGVFERFVLRTGFGWSDEAARYVNVYCIFLGACLGVMKNAHVGVDVFVRLVPMRYQKALGIVTYALCAAFCATVAYTGYSYFLRLQASNQISAALQIPICWVFLAVPLGCGLMCLHYILRLALGDIETPEEVPSNTVKEASHE